MKTSEIALVRRLERAAATTLKKQVRLGIGDDAALFYPRPGFETILTCDWSLEGTHFLRNLHPPDSVGWKCVARAISDIVAIGGEPICFLLSLAIPESCTGKWLDEFLSGLRRAAGRFGCQLAGGDTTRGNTISINITAVGEVRAGRAVLRSGAGPNDKIFVTGTLGVAQLGLQSLQGKGGKIRGRDPSLKRHLYPEPRVALGKWLSARRIATAMMDLSDGLSSDLPRICSASGVGARIDAASIPAPRLPNPHLHGSNRTDLLALALNGGDDYELLFTVEARRAARVPRSFQGTPIKQIGEITVGREVKLVRPDGREQILPARGWDPFRQS